MNETIKVATIPVLILIAMVISGIFLATGVEGALITAWVSATITAFSGYVVGHAAKAAYKGYKALKRGS